MLRRDGAARWHSTGELLPETVLNASNSVDTSVGKLRAEIEGFLNKVAV